jgi:N-formylmaleamate deformylase
MWSRIGICYRVLRFMFVGRYRYRQREQAECRLISMTNWMTGVCEVSGIDIHYLRTGGPKPPLVLLHGLTGNGACWSPLARALEGEYDVVMPDARGHGNSSTPLVGYRYEDYASDVVGLIDGLGLAAPVLLGHSMGGMTAAVVASQRVTAIRGVILADPTFLSPQYQREVHESDAVEQHRRFLGLDRRDVLAQARVRHAHRSPEFIELVTEARLKTRICTFDVLTPPNPEYHQLVSTIHVPILLIIADHGIVSRDTAQELQRLNPRVRVEHIQNAGHAIPYDQPERFAAVVKSFLFFIGPGLE